MNYKAHIVGGAVFAVASIKINNSNLGLDINELYFISGSLFGALLPDIDHPKSFLGSAIQPLSNILQKTIGHRTFTHSLSFAVLVSILVGMVDVGLGIGVGIGVISHIVLDLLTPKTNGVAFLSPFIKKKIKLF